MRQWTPLRAVTLGLSVLCATPAGAGQSAPTAPTFTRDVAPIFQSKCEACHRPDSVAPMSLVTYEETRPWARAIRDRVASRQMPPWHIDRNAGIQHYKNDRSLSDREIATIVAWVSAGAPKGDPKDMPAPVQWADDAAWNFAAQFGGPPDLVVSSPKYTQKATAMDAWFKPTVETGLTEARWVRAIEIRPSTTRGRRITHHALAYLVQDERPAAGTLITADTDSGAGLFMEWAVGKQGELMRPNTGKLMLPGAKIRFEVHYSAVGEDITDDVQLGIYFYPKGQEPKYRTMLSLYYAQAGASHGLDIPPNSVAVNTNYYTMPRAGRIENFQPHMHLRGRAMMVEAILPGTAEQRVLGYVSNFDFNWMTNYVFDDDHAPLLPKGTVIKITSWHDNTASKKGNPDPTIWVGWGDRTVDEMSHAWMNITYMSDQDFEQELAARRARTATTSDRQR